MFAYATSTVVRSVSSPNAVIYPLSITIINVTQLLRILLVPLGSAGRLFSAGFAAKKVLKLLFAAVLGEDRVKHAYVSHIRLFSSFFCC
jgi:hypothetical protein